MAFKPNESGDEATAAIQDAGLSASNETQSAQDQIIEARRRARRMLAGESHLGSVDDWRRVLVSARDAVIIIWLVAVGLHGFDDPNFGPPLLVAMTAGVALLMGISTARSTQARVAYFTDEFERERAEIQNNFDGEREELTALYAAKGLREPLLSQVVDVFCADEDRLLKIMMEEELGLSVYHVNHPLLVGVWNFAGALMSGMVLALPVFWMTPGTAHVWIPSAGLVSLAVLSGGARTTTGRSYMEFFGASLVSAVVTGGTVYFLARWLATTMAG